MPEEPTSQSFTDRAGRRWTVDVTVETVRRVRKTLGIDLTELGNPEKPRQSLAFRLMQDPVLLADVIYCCCQDEAEGRKVSDEDFGRGLAGDAIDEATAALLRAIVLFSRRHDRTRMTVVLERIDRWMELTAQKLMTQAKAPEIDRRFEEALTAALSKSPSSSPAPSASTPAP